jgi:hypothetical protein
MEDQQYFITLDRGSACLELRTLPVGLAASRCYGNRYYRYLVLTSAPSVLSRLTLGEVKVNWRVLIDTEQQMLVT